MSYLFEEDSAELATKEACVAKAKEMIYNMIKVGKSKMTVDQKKAAVKKMKDAYTKWFKANCSKVMDTDDNEVELMNEDLAELTRVIIIRRRTHEEEDLTELVDASAELA